MSGGEERVADRRGAADATDRRDSTVATGDEGVAADDPPNPGTVDDIDVLHVDDHADLLALSQEFLSREDERISVTTETRARDGLERIEADDADVVVSDYQMPNMDGIEFLETVRDRHPELPFIIFTGKGREEVAVEALNLGANRYLQKGGDPASQYGLLADAVVQEVAHSRARQQFRASEERYRRLVEAFPDVVFITDHEGHMLYANPALEDQLGLTVEDFDVDLDENPFHPPEDNERVQQFVLEFLESDDRYSEPFDNRVYDAHGNVHWYSSILAKVTYGGEPALQYICRNISERKEREHRLEETRRRYRTLAESLGGMVALFDEDLRYTGVEGGVLDSFDLAEADFQGTQVTELSPDAPIGADATAYVAVFDGEERIVEFERDGKSFQRHLIPVRDGEEVTVGLELTKET